MSIDDDTLEDGLRREGLDGEEADAIRRVFRRNLETCRIEKFIDEEMSPADYVARLIRYHREWHRQVHRLQVEKSVAAWGPFYVTLQQWAYAFLARCDFGNASARGEDAAACAGQAAAEILDTPFPFDVNFESWAYVILQHMCLRYLDAHWDSPDILQQNPVALDRFEDWLANLSVEPLLADKTDEIALASLRHDLEDAVCELASDARRLFIRLYYFQQRSFDEIAEEMGYSSKNSLYKLHFDALENLRAIWQEKEEDE